MIGGYSPEGRFVFGCCWSDWDCFMGFCFVSEGRAVNTTWLCKCLVPSQHFGTYAKTSCSFPDLGCSAVVPMLPHRDKVSCKGCKVALTVCLDCLSCFGRRSRSAFILRFGDPLETTITISAFIFTICVYLLVHFFFTYNYLFYVWEA